MYLLFRLQRNELFSIFANDFQESLEFKKINYYLQLIEPNGFLCGTTQQRSATYLLCMYMTSSFFIYLFFFTPQIYSLFLTTSVTDVFF